MNVSIETLLADAKFLVGRLKDHDTAAEGLAEQTSALQKDIESRNIYQESLKELNKVAGHRPRSTLVLGIQQENCAIRSLQNENDELRHNLQEHQNALELIMAKYRHQMVQFMNNKNLLQVFPTKSKFSSEEKQDMVKAQILTDKIYEMAAVMQRAISIDETTQQEQQEYISRLEAENNGLRDLLLITNGHRGSNFTSESEKTEDDHFSCEINTVTNNDNIVNFKCLHNSDLLEQTDFEQSVLVEFQQSGLHKIVKPDIQKKEHLIEESQQNGEFEDGQLAAFELHESALSDLEQSVLSKFDNVELNDNTQDYTADDS